MPDVSVLHKAREMVDRLDYPAARQLLREALGQTPAQPGDADNSDADLAAFYAGVLLQLGEPHAARGWAAYAHTAAQRLHGEHDRRTTHALGVLACALHRAGARSRSAHHYRQLIEALTTVEGSDSDRTLAARADAAVVDHARGACSAARAQLNEVIAAHVTRHGQSHPVSIRLMARLAAMWRDCGDVGRAQELLYQARRAAAVLDPGDDTHRLLAAAAQAEPDANHHCGVVALARPPTTAAGVYDVPSGPADEWPLDEGGFDSPSPPVAASPVPVSTVVPPAAPSPAEMSPARIGPASSPTPSLPADPGVSRTPPPQQNPPGGPRGKRPLPVTAMVATGAVIAAMAAVVTAAVVFADQRQAANPVLSTTSPPQTSPSTGLTPSAAATFTTASPDRTQPATPPVPVSDLDLVDEADRLVISWGYPSGATAPVIISVSRAGEPMRPLQSLPAGTDSFVLPGLDPRADYCVAVTVAYRADQTVMSPPVCTTRTSTRK